MNSVYSCGGVIENDIILARNKKLRLEEIKKHLISVFKMKDLGELKKFRRIIITLKQKKQNYNIKVD